MFRKAVRKGPLYAAAAFYFVVAGALHWKVLFAINEKLLFGNATGSFFAWLFWWRKYALVNGLEFFYTPMVMAPKGIPIFFVTPFYELLSLPLQLFLSPTVLVNLFFIFSYSLVGLSAFYLFYRATNDAWGALCGSFIYAFSRLMITQHWHGHLDETLLFFIPVMVVFLFDFARHPDRKTWLRLAVIFALMVLSGPYIMVYGAGFLIAFSFLYYLIRRRRLVLKKEILLGGAGLAGVGILLVLALYWPVFSLWGKWQLRPDFYPTHLTSFINVPFWHSVSWVHSLRLSPSFPEADMAYLGLLTLGLIFWGAARKGMRSAAFRYYFFLWLGSSVLILGPELHIAQDWETNFPLPYKLLQVVPFIESLRVSGRIYMLGALAAGGMVSLVLGKLFRGKSDRFKIIACALFLGFYVFESDLLKIGNRYVNPRPSPLLDIIKRDPEPGMVLNLPDAVLNQGYPSIVSQYYMYLATFHEKPILLGSPPRNLNDTFTFINSDVLLYLLSHPWYIEHLKPDRRNHYAEMGPDHLKGLGIRYILYHEYAWSLSDKIKIDTKEFLDDLYGEPAVVDQENGMALYLPPADQLPDDKTKN